MTEQKNGSLLYHWLRLLRLPNLFTVPGDPLLGFLAAGGAGSDKNLYLAMAASLLLYIYGLITNDIADIKVDKEERPDRPLPGGYISPRSAKIVAILVTIGALVTAIFAGDIVLFIALLLFMAISSYNFVFKNNPVTGPALIAYCRAGNIALGIAASGMPNGMESGIFILFVFGIIVFFYFYGISKIAQTETILSNKKPGRIFIMFAVIMSAIILGTFIFLRATKLEMNPVRVFGIALSLIALIGFVWDFFRNYKVFSKTAEPVIVQKTIGRLIGNIILFQAAVCAVFTDNFLPALILITCVPISRIAAKKFYGS